MKQKIQFGVLAVLGTTLAYFGYQRIGIRMGGTPSSIQSRFDSEEHWIVETLLTDIAETVAYSRDVPLEEVRVDYELISGSPFELPSVKVQIELGVVTAVDRTIELEQSFWTPQNYESLAMDLLGPTEVVERAGSEATVRDSLLEPTLATLLAESERIGSFLRVDSLDVLAHEEAAVLLGVFGLREAALGFNDTRTLLTRMTAHLALAGALRADAPSEIALLASATLSALTGRQEELFDKLDDVSSDAWAGALYMFSTDDWRREVASDELLVQLMRFRAMVSSLGASSAIERTGEAAFGETAEWGRIVSWLGWGDVASGSFVNDQIERELAEAQEVSLTYLGKALERRDLIDALNASPEGMFRARSPQVLDWGLWAQFYQRHVCGAIVAADRMLRRTYGLPEQAVSFGHDIDRVVSGLDLNPIVQVRRTRIVGGHVEDTVGMDAAIALTHEHPELVSPWSWGFLEDTVAHIMLKRGVPSSMSWLSPAVMTTSVFVDTRTRFDIFERSVNRAEALAALGEIAPNHAVVIDETAEQMEDARKLAVNPDENTYAEMSKRIGARADFDLYALRELRDLATEVDDRLDVMKKMCGIDVDECADFGWDLAFYEREDEALAAFEHFVEAASSGVRVCNHASWLVNYYYDGERLDDAVALAEQARSPGCSWGILTRAHLLERMGEYGEAEREYQAEAARYESDGPVAPPLFGFYYRRSQVDGVSEYDQRFESLLSQVFPNGLEALPDDSGAVAPSDGVLIDGMSERVEAAGLRGSDVIVGMDGWQVRTLDQYDAIRAMRDPTSNVRDMKLRIWRQTQYLDPAPEVRGRLLQVRMRTFGTPGPSYLWR